MRIRNSQSLGSQSDSMLAEVCLQALALLGTGVWVCRDTIGGLGVQSSSGGSVPSVWHVLLHTRVDNRSF